MIYYTPCGCTINEAIRIALRKARRAKKTVRLKFNGRVYTVRPKSTEDSVYYQFERMTGMYESYFGVPYSRPRVANEQHRKRRK